jgi:A/G-specific adenine glycosylase
MVDAGPATLAALRRAFRRYGLTPATVRKFRNLVYAHYETEGRTFPWRETDDPYRILVSEIMLQQTQTSRVLVKWAPFLAAFPTVQALAAASQREVLAAWQGLGYNRRALNLHRAAKAIVAEHGGRVPDSTAALTGLPGVGRDTAGAVLVLAFNRPAAYLETNIRAVYHHVFSPEGTMKDGEVRELVGKTLDREDPRRWYFALYDYGASLKRARQAGPVKRKQSRFEGSDRQVRGAVLRLLLERREVAEEEAPGLLGEPAERVARLLGQLRDEGFVEVKDGRIRLRD